MHNYFIESFKITKLWGYRDINLTFNNDVNILIGPNASGKTTILNLLHSILSADLPGLLNVNFEEAEIKLRGFKGRSVRTVTARVDATDRLLELGVGAHKFSLEIDSIFVGRYPGYYRDETGRIVRRTLPRHPARRRIVPEEFYDELTALVPLVWLPVSRRLPVAEDEEEQYIRTRALEAEEVLKRIRKSENIGWDLEDILVVPLIGRTKAMVEYARKLEEDRERIFASFRVFSDAGRADTSDCRDTLPRYCWQISG